MNDLVYVLSLFQKFSVQGGMGAAQLSNPDNACNIVSNLSKNLSIPVSAKVRLLDTIEELADKESHFVFTFQLLLMERCMHVTLCVQERRGAAGVM